MTPHIIQFSTRPATPSAAHDGRALDDQGRDAAGAKRVVSLHGHHSDGGLSGPDFISANPGKPSFISFLRLWIRSLRPARRTVLTLGGIEINFPSSGSVVSIAEINRSEEGIGNVRQVVRVCGAKNVCV